MKVIKKRIPVDAYRYTGWPPVDPPDWFQSAFAAKVLNPVPNGIQVASIDGAVYANIGDYLICGGRGEIYPIKADIFDETYDPADNGMSDVEMHALAALVTGWGVEASACNDDRKSQGYAMAYSGHPCMDAVVALEKELRRRGALK